MFQNRPEDDYLKAFVFECHVMNIITIVNEITVIILAGADPVCPELLARALFHADLQASLAIARGPFAGNYVKPEPEHSKRRQAGGFGVRTSQGHNADPDLLRRWDTANIRFIC